MDLPDHLFTSEAAVRPFKDQHKLATTPQIFNNGRRIGGYSDLAALLQLMNVPAFASSFCNDDLLSQRLPLYARLDPGLELLVALNGPAWEGSPGRP